MSSERDVLQAIRESEEQRLTESTEYKHLPLHELAVIIFNDWKNMPQQAKVYAGPMMSLTSLSGMYGQDEASSIVEYFLSNAGSWRGEVAKEVKKELRARLSAHYKKTRTNESRQLTEANLSTQDVVDSSAKTLYKALVEFQEELRRMSEEHAEQIDMYLRDGLAFAAQEEQETSDVFSENDLDEIAEFIVGLNAKYSALIGNLENAIERGD